MNKNITLGIGFILVAIIAYQGYLLSQKGDLKKDIVTAKESKNDTQKPKININFKNQQTNQKQIQNQNPSNSFALNPTDKERIEKSFKDLINSIFASKEVQESLKEFKAQATMGIQELQKEIQNLPKQLDNLSSQLKDDPLLGELFQNLKSFDTKSFEDNGKEYITTIETPKDAKIDIDVENDMLTISISKTQNTLKKTQNSTIKSSQTQNSQIVIPIPSDTLVEKMKTEYKNGKLTIKIPKIGKKSSI